MQNDTPHPLLQTWGWPHVLPLILSISKHPASGDCSVTQTFLIFLCSTSHSVIPESASGVCSRSRRGKWKSAGSWTSSTVVYGNRQKDISWKEQDKFCAQRQVDIKQKCTHKSHGWDLLGLQPMDIKFHRDIEIFSCFGTSRKTMWCS